MRDDRIDAAPLVVPGFRVVRAVGAAELGALVHALATWAVGQGCRTLHLAVRENNPRAQRFWERMGFRVVDRRIRVTADGEMPVWKMVRPLVPAAATVAAARAP